MTRGTYDKTSPRIGFDNWNLIAIEEGAVDLLKQAFKEALDIATSEYDCDAVFAFNEDTLIVRVGLPLGAEEYDDPAWTFSPDEMVNDVVLLEDSEEYVTKLRDELRRLANRLDSALKSG